ncbi:MAG: hypothetical protein LE169_03445 [Endomicrobium sp.]|nr:hypothetical protein [Endomicrobium sp.]
MQKVSEQGLKAVIKRAMNTPRSLSSAAITLPLTGEAPQFAGHGNINTPMIYSLSL